MITFSCNPLHYEYWPPHPYSLISNQQPIDILLVLKGVQQEFYNIPSVWTGGTVLEGDAKIFHQASIQVEAVHHLSFSIIIECFIWNNLALLVTKDWSFVSTPPLHPILGSPDTDLPDLSILTTTGHLCKSSAFHFPLNTLNKELVITSFNYSRLYMITMVVIDLIPSKGSSLLWDPSPSHVRSAQS